MNVKSYILKLLVLPKSATFLFVALLLAPSLNAQNISKAAFILPPGLSSSTFILPPGLSFAAFVLPPGLGGGK